MWGDVGEGIIPRTGSRPAPIPATLTAMSAIDLVIFDLAGTTVDDGGALVAAFRGTLARFSVPFEENDLQAVRGANKLQVFRQFAVRAFGPGPEAVRVAQEAHLAFTEELQHEYRTGPLATIDGVETTFAALKQRDIKLATNSGFGREIAETILTRLGWRGMLDAEVCGDDVSAGRPAPFMIHLAMERAAVQDARRVMAVGDTPLDLQAGTRAGCGGVVGVLTGAHGIETLGATRHTHIIPSVADLPALLTTEFA
jgi:phosphonatase-like hydrolase